MRTFRKAFKDVTAIIPPRPHALALYEALITLQAAQAAFDAAVASVPAYTAQWDPVDYYGEQENNLNRAIDAFEVAVALSRAVEQ